MIFDFQTFDRKNSISRVRVGFEPHAVVESYIEKIDCFIFGINVPLCRFTFATNAGRVASS